MNYKTGPCCHVPGENARVKDVALTEKAGCGEEQGAIRQGDLQRFRVRKCRVEADGRASSGSDAGAGCGATRRGGA